MRYSLILAGGSGTRLWPMSTAVQPKQLIPFINGRSLLQIAHERLDGLIAPENRYICAGNAHRNAILDRLHRFDESRFIGEPTGRDTLNALAYSAAVLHGEDPEAVMAVFTADHIIEPVGEFLKIVEKGYEIVENNENTLVTFGITPDHAATGFGYLELGDEFYKGSRKLKQFREKPEKAGAEKYYAAGPESYLWNSGMFVWKASTLLECVKKYEYENYKQIMKIADSRGTKNFESILGKIYPDLKKISIDFAVMEPASKDDGINVVSVPMPLTWLDIGSWTAFAGICEKDDSGNSFGIKNQVLLDSSDNLLVSEEENHLIAGIGLEGLIVIHTPGVTMICPKDRDQEIKKLYGAVREKYGDNYI